MEEVLCGILCCIGKLHLVCSPSSASSALSIPDILEEEEVLWSRLRSELLLKQHLNGTLAELYQAVHFNRVY